MPDLQKHHLRMLREARGFDLRMVRAFMKWPDQRFFRPSQEEVYRLDAFGASPQDARCRLFLTALECPLTNPLESPGAFLYCLQWMAEQNQGWTPGVRLKLIRIARDLTIYDICKRSSWLDERALRRAEAGRTSKSSPIWFFAATALEIPVEAIGPKKYDPVEFWKAVVG